MGIENFAWEQANPRIVQFKGKRYALRLENIFWQQLEKLAEKRRQRVGQLVAELQQDYEGANFSSYIRGFCMVEAERENARHRLTSGAFDLIDVLHACPSPAILLNQHKQIIEVNQAMHNWVEPREQGHVRPVFKHADFETLFTLRAVRSLDDTLALMRAGQLKRTQLQLSYVAQPGDAPRIILATFTGLPVGNIFYLLVWLAPVAPYRTALR